MMLDPYTEISEPEVYSPQNVMYWEAHSKELLQLRKEGKTKDASLLGKAKKFLENGCIARDGHNFICKPLQNYNSSLYTIRSTEKGFICNCQGCQTKLKNQEKPFCCHILAVYQFCFLEAHQ